MNNLHHDACMNFYVNIRNQMSIYGCITLEMQCYVRFLTVIPRCVETIGIGVVIRVTVQKPRQKAQK